MICFLALTRTHPTVTVSVDMRHNWSYKYIKDVCLCVWIPKKRGVEGLLSGHTAQNWFQRWRYLINSDKEAAELYLERNPAATSNIR